MLAKRHLGNQKGFTLIEIISVLVLLGILSAYAVPKYFDMQAEAENKILSAAVADMRSRAVMHYGELLLSSGVVDFDADQDAFADLDITDPVGDIYVDYPGGWVLTSPVLITYTPKFGAVNTTFTLTTGDADGPATITVAP